MSQLRPFDLLVVGEINADLILRGDVTPAFGQIERLIADATLTIGSSSAIFACGAARLGLRVAFAGLVGDDPIGRFMCGALAERGIDTSGVVVDPALKTGLTVILARADDRALLTFPGSIAALRLAHIDLGLLHQARHLHVGGYFLLDSLRPAAPELFAAARAAGCSTSLDTNYDPAERWDGVDALLPFVEYLLPNEVELLALADTDQIEPALARLTAFGSTVLVKRGAQGAVAQRGAERYAAAPPSGIAIVETTGAGDSFDAGAVYGILAGWPLERALRLGCVCGALSARAAGGTAAQPTLAEALEYLGT